MAWIIIAILLLVWIGFAVSAMLKHPDMLLTKWQVARREIEEILQDLLPDQNLKQMRQQKRIAGF